MATRAARCRSSSSTMSIRPETTGRRGTGLYFNRPLPVQWANSDWGRNVPVGSDSTEYLGIGFHNAQRSADGVEWRALAAQSKAADGGPPEDPLKRSLSQSGSLGSTFTGSLPSIVPSTVTNAECLFSTIQRSVFICPQAWVWTRPKQLVCRLGISDRREQRSPDPRRRKL